MDSINIGVSSWIIQDGNYKDFHVGETHQFALEFYPPKSLHQSPTTQRRIVPVAAEEYEVSARVAFVSTTVWVIDCGLLLFREEHPPRTARIERYVRGTVRVGIDPFFYKEYLHSEPGMPSLDYRVMIERISIETTPWSTKWGVTRRRGARTFRAIERTDARNDEEGNAHYILHCHILANAAA